MADERRLIVNEEDSLLLEGVAGKWDLDLNKSSHLFRVDLSNFEQKYGHRTKLA